MTEIKYVGIEELPIENMQRLEVHALVEKHAKRIERIVHNELELVVHVKASDITGQRAKFSISIRAVYPGGTTTASKDDWQMLVGLQHALEAIEQQLAHKFKI